MIQTPLHLAASVGYPTCIEALLDYGALMDLRNMHMETAKDLAKGKVICEQMFHRAIAKDQIPYRSVQQQKIVESK
jgi:ankyrin repeat protein